jgi:hypothetical protein
MSDSNTQVRRSSLDIVPQHHITERISGYASLWGKLRTADTYLFLALIVSPGRASDSPNNRNGPPSGSLANR